MRSLLLFLIAALTTACGMKSPVANREGQKPRYFLDAMTNSDSYSQTFRKHTRTDRSHSGFLPVILAHATFWNQTMREAYLAELAGRFRLDETEEKKLALEELAEDESYIVFVVSVSTGEPEWNDLHQKNSLWAVTLENENGSVRKSPQRIDLVSYKDERAKYFFQKMDAFNQTYKIFFERNSFQEATDLRLHISGVRGHLRFSWPNDRRPEATTSVQQ
jgi:hypothetical protein